MNLPAAAVAGRRASTYILGIPFFQGTVLEAVREACEGGLIVFPAAPALKEIARDEAYREALLSANLVAADSAFMVLCWYLLRRKSVTRISGLAYLRELLRTPSMRQQGNVMWVMASAADARRNAAWLRGQRIAVREEDVYVAPSYAAADDAEQVRDDTLLARVALARPKHIVLTVGGGTQEKLGSFLMREADYRPAIHCVGAAIAFLSGAQVHIPVWADRLYLGWLFRVLAEPSRLGRRYWEAVALFGMLRRYGAELPPMDGGAASISQSPGS